MHRVAELCRFLASDAARGITGKLISAVWDNWSIGLSTLMNCARAMFIRCAALPGEIAVIPGAISEFGGWDYWLWPDGPEAG